MNYTVKAAARATGVSESRLRTWERRYSIPHPGRSASGRRLYGEDDISIIRRMASLVEAGMSAAQAAEAARSGQSAAREQPEEEHSLVRVIAVAAERYDDQTVQDALQQGIGELGWSEALHLIIFPALRRIGLYWESDTLRPAGEHLASELIRRELHASISRLPAPASSSPRVLLACPEDERHDLGLTALALLLKEKGVWVIYLGADVPTADLVEAFDATKSDAVCLSATSSVGLASLVRASRSLALARRLRLFVGGPAVQTNGSEVAAVRLPDRIDQASQALVTALRE